MQLTMRLYQTKDDYWRIRAFLRQVFVLNERRMQSWPVARLDYWLWHGILNMHDGQLETEVFMWETDDGQLAAVLNHESAGHAFLQVHPGFRTAELEEEMIDLAERLLRATSQKGSLALWVWADSCDDLRQSILLRRGFTRVADAVEHQWRRDLAMPILNVPIAPEYTVRSLGDVDELPARSWASWKAFHPDEPDEQYEGWKWYLNIQSAPLYRRDLDLVAVTATGEIVAFTTVWYDDATRSAYFEPVGTLPAHQRRGLGKAVMTEGLRRLKQMGATRALVTGGGPPANALYQSVMGSDYDLSEPWEKRW